MPSSQQLIGKVQPRDLFLRTLDAVADAGIHAVINYITGFPREDVVEGRRMFLRVEADTAERLPRLKAMLEKNVFELERLAPLARNPAAHGIEIVRQWPWASVLDWRPIGGARRASSDCAPAACPARCA